MAEQGVISSVGFNEQQVRFIREMMRTKHSQKRPSGRWHKKGGGGGGNTAYGTITDAVCAVGEYCVEVSENSKCVDPVGGGECDPSTARGVIATDPLGLLSYLTQAEAVGRKVFIVRLFNLDTCVAGWRIVNVNPVLTGC